MMAFAAFIFLCLSIYVTMADRVLQRFQKGLHQDFGRLPQMHIDALRKNHRMHMTLMVAGLLANLAFMACLLLPLGLPVTGLATFGLTFFLAYFVLLVVARVLPRIFVARFTSVSFRFVAWTAPYLLAPFYLLSIPLLMLGRRLTVVQGVQNDDEFFGSVTETEILHFVEAGAKAGSLERYERDMIRSVIELSDTIAREVMVPRTKIVSIEEGTPVREVLAMISRSGLTRIPVFRENIDNIIGILYAKDLLRCLESNLDQPDLMAGMMHDPVFVPETKKVVELLADFNRSRTHIAIVVDEYGGTAGLITVEDILEEIVGEIHDEYDPVGQAPILKIDEHTYQVLGQTPIYEIRDHLKINIEEKDDFDSIAGFISDAMGKIPKTGEIHEQDGVRYTILEADDRRILKIKMEIREDSADG